MFTFILNWLKKRRVAWSSVPVPEKNTSHGFQIQKQVHLHWHVSDSSQIPQNVIWNAGQLVTPNVATVDTTARIYDKELLERVRMQWQFGEWETLSEIDVLTVEQHPDRAKIALVVASAWLQLGDSIQARKFTQHAKEWGCDKKLIAQLLIAGVHNTLGRVASLNGDEVRAMTHFRDAVKGVSGDSKLASQVRIQRELGNLEVQCQSQKITSSKPEPKIIDSEQENTIFEPYNGIVSYAQNFEDVMLWRALHHVKNGFYIDVGAQDPIFDSVSKAFYENGWRGIHVEPIHEYAEALRFDRPDEQVIEALLAAEEGSRTIYKILQSGLSTCSEEFAERHRQIGWKTDEIITPSVTLESIFYENKKTDIHWMKIDVEGMEEEVLRGWKNHPARPWIFVIEATEPNCQTPTWQQWEHHLLARDYQFVYFDGLNRFYIHREHSELSSAFKVPPNCFDRWVLFHLM